MFWTKYHAYVVIPTFIISLLAAFFIGRALRNKDDKIKMLPIQIVTIVLLGLEVWKQVRGFIVGYDLYWIPLHFCSLFLYTLPLASFYKGKYKNEARVLASVVGACLFLFMAVYPAIIYPGEAVPSALNYLLGKGGYFGDFHTVVFHSVAVFSFFLFVFLDVCDYSNKRNLLAVIFFMALYCVIVGPFSQIIKVNFNNFCHCNAPFIENVRVKLTASENWAWLGQTVYVIVISIGTILVPVIAYYFTKLVKKLTNRINKA